MPSDDLSFGARSIYGANTGRGLVEVTAGGEPFTVTPAKARELAALLLEAATAAEGDEMLMRVLEAATAAEGDEVVMRVLDRIGMSPQRSAQVLIAMRQERAIIERKARQEARAGFAFDQEDADFGN